MLNLPGKKSRQYRKGSHLAGWLPCQAGGRSPGGTKALVCPVGWRGLGRVPGGDSINSAPGSGLG